MTKSEILTELGRLDQHKAELGELREKFRLLHNEMNAKAKLVDTLRVTVHHGVPVRIERYDDAVLFSAPGSDQPNRRAHVTFHGQFNLDRFTDYKSHKPVYYKTRHEAEEAAFDWVVHGDKPSEEELDGVLQTGSYDTLHKTLKRVREYLYG